MLIQAVTPISAEFENLKESLYRNYTKYSNNHDTKDIPLTPFPQRISNSVVPYSTIFKTITILNFIITPHG